MPHSQTVRRLWFKPCHIRITQNGADQSRLRFFVAQRQGFSRHPEGVPSAERRRSALTSGCALVRHGCGMLPQAGIPCSWRAREPTAEKIIPHFRTIRRLWFKPALTHGKGLPKGNPFPWRRDRDLRLWRRALVGARRILRASAFGKRRAIYACSSSSRKSFAAQNLCGSPAISPPGCSVCAELICQQTIRAQTVCSRKRLHPQIPVKIDTTENGAD